MQVVLVDDDRRFCAMARRALEAEGVSVVAEVSDGAEAVAAVAEWCPDVVLVDVRMPGVDGMEVARRLQGKTSATVILISTHAEDDVARLVADIPASFLSKAELTGEAIRRVLEAGTR